MSGLIGLFWSDNYLVKYIFSNSLVFFGTLALWFILAALTGFPKNQFVADFFAVIVLPCTIMVQLSHLDELFLMTATVTYMAATVLGYFGVSGAKPDVMMVAHHVLTVILILMGCASEQALQQKFMSITLLVEISSPFVSFWRKKTEQKWRLQLLLASFFIVRILGFGVYTVYMCGLAALPNERFDRRPLHVAITVTHVLLFLMFIQWFSKQLKMYTNWDPSRMKKKSNQSRSLA